MQCKPLDAIDALEINFYDNDDIDLLRGLSDPDYWWAFDLRHAYALAFDWMQTAASVTDNLCNFGFLPL